MYKGQEWIHRRIADQWLPALHAVELQQSNLRERGKWLGEMAKQLPFWSNIHNKKNRAIIIAKGYIISTNILQVNLMRNMIDAGSQTQDHVIGNSQNMCIPKAIKSQIAESQPLNFHYISPSNSHRVKLASEV